MVLNFNVRPTVQGHLKTTMTTRRTTTTKKKKEQEEKKATRARKTALFTAL